MKNPFWNWNLVTSIVAGSSMLFAGKLLVSGFDEESIRVLIRWTARISVVLFCLAFGASALHALLQNSTTWWVRMNRKYLGISFAIIHLIHLAVLIVLQVNFHPVFERAAPQALFAGAGAYLFIVLMLLTSFDRFADRLSKNAWKNLHLVGGFWIWGVFMTSYWRRALTEYTYLPIALLLVVVMGLRVWKLFKTSPRPAA